MGSHGPPSRNDVITADTTGREAAVMAGPEVISWRAELFLTSENSSYVTRELILVKYPSWAEGSRRCVSDVCGRKGRMRMEWQA